MVEGAWDPDDVNGTKMSLVERPPVSVALCITINYAVALLIVDSRWGSVLFMDDQFGIDSVGVPVAAGALLGLVQTLTFGPRTTLVAMGIGLLGVLTLLLAFTLVAQAAGIAAGCVVALAVRSDRSGETRVASR